MTAPTSVFQRRALIAAVALLVLVAGTLYRKVLRLWWTYDDAFNLHLIVEHRLSDAFSDSAMWPQRLFTPLLLATNELQFGVFGLDPRRWYMFHLTIAVLATVALLFALREWLSLPAATAGALLFVSAVPLCALVMLLSGVHYFLAVLFGALATLVFRRVDGWKGASLSSLLYLFGMLAKETIVPLPLVLFFLMPRARRKLLLAHGAMLLIYLAWRRAVIGTILGGYGWAVEPAHWPVLIASLPGKLALATAGADLRAGIAMLAVTAIGVVLALRHRAAAVLFVVGMVAAAGPVLPVSKEMQRRYALMPWICWSVAFAAGADRLAGRRKLILLTTACALTVVANRQEWQQEYGRTRRMSDEGRFFFDMPAGALLRAPVVPPAAMGELAWLKTHAGRPAGAGWFYDDLYLCRTPPSGPVWEYDLQRRAVVNVPAIAEVARRHCQSIRHGAPLRTDFRYEDGSLFWTFGPYEDGQYRVLLGDGVQAFDVPRADGFRLPDLPGLTLIVRYTAPSGWTTYSPPIFVDFTKPRTTWQRGMAPVSRSAR